MLKKNICCFNRRDIYGCQVSSNSTSTNSTENVPKNVTDSFDVERIEFGLRCSKQSSQNLTTYVNSVESSAVVSSGDLSETVVSSRSEKSVMFYYEEDSGSGQDSFLFKRSTGNNTIDNVKEFSSTVCYFVEKLKAGEERLDDYWKR